MFWSKKKKESKVKTVTDDNFNEIITTSEKGILLDFYADWCGPCKVIGPIIEELAEEFDGRVIIGKVDTEVNHQLSEFFKIKSIPTLVFIKQQKMIERINGLVPKPNLEEMLEDLISFQFPPDTYSEEE